MYIRLGHQWHPDHLDHDCGHDEVRIDVKGWAVLALWDDAHISPQRRWSTVLDYTRRVGPVATARKILSRLQMAQMAKQCVAVGFGQCLESMQWLGFVAVGVPTGLQRVVVPSALTITLDEALAPTPQHSLLWCMRLGQHDPPALWPHMATDAPQSIDSKWLNETLHAINWHRAQTVRLQSQPIKTRTHQAQKNDLILFGYGHYARTCIVPYLKDVTLTTIHEVNPILSQPKQQQYTWDSSPNLRTHEQARAVWAAGYHHTHGPIAVDALKKGMWAVVEKPAITTDEQLRELTQQLHQNPRLLIGFHKRWAKPTAWIQEDLQLNGQPCHLHSIVHEIPLPQHHWYRWPNAQSRILSNGCHWLDHFLWLNPNTKVSQWSVQGRQDHLMVWVVLNNGATCSLLLSDEGSSRIGVRDVSEYRAGDRTARWIDGSSYESENTHKVIRRETLNPMDVYPTMVRAFCDIITHDRVALAEPIDHLNTLHQLLLHLNDAALALPDRLP